MFLQISYNAMTLPSFQTAFSKSASDSAELIYQGSKPSALTNFSSPSYTGNQKKIPQQKFHGSIQRRKKNNPIIISALQCKHCETNVYEKCGIKIGLA